jgi:hypothetical protein
MEGSFLIPSEDVVCFFFSIIESLQNGPKQKEARTNFLCYFVVQKVKSFVLSVPCALVPCRSILFGEEGGYDRSESHLEEEMIIMSTTTIFNLEVATVVVVPPPPRYSQP